MSLAIGIDLGTTTSCAYIYQNSNLDIIPLTKQNSRLIPSCVFFDEDEIIIGEDAEKRSAINPNLGIYDAKRMIGRKFNDDFVTNNLRNWPFVVKPGPNNECQFEIKKTKVDTPITISPEEISAEILKQIKKDAEKYLKQEIKDVVITVPAYFNDAQRRATQKAAHFANLNVLEIVNEPTAAALAYVYQKEYLDRTILVYDLGGGTYDVSLVKFTNGEGKVIAKKGDCNLGGRNFDNNLKDFILRQGDSNAKINQIVDLNQRRLIRRLKTISKTIKEKLSQSISEDCELDELFESEETLTITRNNFEQLNAELFQKTINILDNALSEANIAKSEIDDIVLVGGSSRIPKIRQLLSEYFEGKNLSHGINPDEAVAMGASIRAAILNGNYGGKIEMTSLHDITPYSLGVKIFPNIMDVVIPRGSAYPITVTKEGYTTALENQTEINICIFEGEEKKTKDNKQIGQLLIENITLQTAKSVEINIEFNIDANGILVVTATEISNNISKSVECHLNYS